MNRQAYSRIVFALTFLVMVGMGRAFSSEDPATTARECVSRYKAAVEAAKLPVGAPLAASTKGPDRNDLLTAITLYQKAGAGETSEEALRRAYIEALTLAEYDDLAAEQWEFLTKAHPEDATLWREMGRAWYASGPAGNEKALAALNQSKKLDPNAADTYGLIGQVYHRSGLYKEAGDAYREALSRQPDHVRAIIGLAVIDAREGRILEAAKPLDALGSAAQPYDIETRIMLRKALYDFESGRGLFPDDAEHQSAYAKLLYRAGRLPDALMAANRAIALKEDDIETLNFLGAMLMQIGQTAKAQEIYKKSLSIKPDQPNISAALQQMNTQK